MADNNMMIVLVLGAIGYWYFTMGPGAPQLITTDADAAAYNKKISTETAGLETVRALATGIGDTDQEDGLCPDGETKRSRLTLSMQLFPKPQFEGWDNVGRAVDADHPTDSDGNTQYIYQEDYAFFDDYKACSGEIVTDSNGARLIPLATQVNGQKKYHFKSFKIGDMKPIMMIVHYSAGVAPQVGFMLRAINCRDVVHLLRDYPELTGGNNGINWDRGRDGDVWRITCLNSAAFQRELLKKFGTCLDLAMGNSSAQIDPKFPYLKGLHYANGTQILDPSKRAPDNYANGRWVYDVNCRPVVDPVDYKQGYILGSGGWGYDCKKAYDYCALEPGVMVGIKLSQFGITDKGIPATVGVNDWKPNSGHNPVSTWAESLSPDLIGWTQATSAEAGSTVATTELTAEQVAAQAQVDRTKAAMAIASTDEQKAQTKAAFDAATLALSQANVNAALGISSGETNPNSIVGYVDKFSAARYDARGVGATSLINRISESSSMGYESVVTPFNDRTNYRSPLSFAPFTNNPTNTRYMTN